MCFYCLTLSTFVNRVCSNNSSWIEKNLSLEGLPDSLLQTLMKGHDLSKLQNNLGSSTLELLLGSTGDISRRTSMMKFLRNSTLLCLTVFPRNYILEEAALVAEELSVTKMNSDSSVTPCRTLAKRLLKADRQVFTVTFHFLIADMCMFYFFSCKELLIFGYVSFVQYIRGTSSILSRNIQG